MENTILLIPYVEPGEMFVKFIQRVNAHGDTKVEDATMLPHDFQELFKGHHGFVWHLMEHPYCRMFAGASRYDLPPVIVGSYYCISGEPGEIINCDECNIFKYRISTLYHYRKLYIFKIVGGIVKPISREDYKSIYCRNTFKISKRAYDKPEDPLKPK